MLIPEMLASARTRNTTALKIAARILFRNTLLISKRKWIAALFSRFGRRCVLLCVCVPCAVWTKKFTLQHESFNFTTSIELFILIFYTVTN